MPTPEAEAMKAIVQSNASLLKSAGFRKRRHGFNRRTPDGLVQVVHFWMAPFEPSAWTEVPGLRERQYGGFRLDFGVWVPEMIRSHPPKSDWVNDYDCQLRRTIGQLLGHSDLWWSLTDANSFEASHSALVDHGLPWLEGLDSKQAVLDAFEREGSLAVGLSPAGALDISDLYNSLGHGEQARRTLAAYVEEPVTGGHARYLAEFLATRGHGDLVDRIVTRDHPTEND